jgi:chromosome segregation ATPase
MNNILKKIIHHNEADDNGLLNALKEKTNHLEQAVKRNEELEADVNGLVTALNEKTGHWEEAVNRNRELEAELVWLHKGNRGLMEELQFLKSKNKELSDLHDEVVLRKWSDVPPPPP